MKYLKKFENSRKYQIGDYIKPDIDQIRRNNGETDSRYDANYKDFPEKAQIIDYDDRNNYPYSVKYNNNSCNNAEICNNLSYNEIDRFLTPEEIKDYELDIVSQSYNL